MRVIYIAGTSHSGSTLLALMLNAHPAIFAAGELKMLHGQLVYKDPKKKIYPNCPCGASSVLTCDFWSRVDQRLMRAYGKSLRELDLLDYRNSHEGSEPNSILLKTISEISGKEFVVDASKSPRRLLYLIQQGLDVYPVHIIRQPHGQIYSMTKKYGGLLRHIIRYELVHNRIRRMLKHIPHGVVHYEDLVSAPESTLRSVLEPLGLEFDLRQLSWAEQENHTVAGNRMRRQHKSQLVLDEKWQDGLNFAQKLVIGLGTLHSRQSLPRAGSLPEMRPPSDPRRQDASNANTKR